MTDEATRYFKRTRLDYPTNETTRASRRFVKAMKKLHVRTAEQPPLRKWFQERGTFADRPTGDYTTQRESIPETILGPFEEDIRL